MERFTTLDAIAAPLPLANIDTDKILAGRFLKTISRAGLGNKLFHSMRFAADGSEDAEFILNRPPWRDAKILVALENFGCGSSREHAPWALRDFGISCVIAPSFADIFYNNCFKNGILPIRVDAAMARRMIALAGNAATARMTVDLPAQTVTLSDREIVPFGVEPERKSALLEGLDEIAATLLQVAAIDRWERDTQIIAPPITSDAINRD